MKALVQRVASSELTVEGRFVSRIGEGMVCYLGVEQGDTDDDLRWLVNKVANLRIFSDDAGKMNLSALARGFGIMVVSQFTLLGDIRRGFRPSFSQAEAPERARALYEAFAVGLRTAGIADVAMGEFAADMTIQQVNRGPVTIWIDSRARGGE